MMRVGKHPGKTGCMRVQAEEAFHARIHMLTWQGLPCGGGQYALIVVIQLAHVVKFSGKRDHLYKRFGVWKATSGFFGRPLGLAYCPANVIAVGLSQTVTLCAVGKPCHINLPTDR